MRSNNYTILIVLAQRSNDYSVVR